MNRCEERFRQGRASGSASQTEPIDRAVGPRDCCWKARQRQRGRADRLSRRACQAAARGWRLGMVDGDESDAVRGGVAFTVCPRRVRRSITRASHRGRRFSSRASKRRLVGRQGTKKDKAKNEDESTATYWGTCWGASGWRKRCRGPCHQIQPIAEIGSGWLGKGP